jgi:hypothetical protein
MELEMMKATDERDFDGSGHEDTKKYLLAKYLGNAQQLCRSLKEKGEI